MTAPQPHIGLQGGGRHDRCGAGHFDVCAQGLPGVGGLGGSTVAPSFVFRVHMMISGTSKFYFALQMQQGSP